jgi:hypothetical protein
MVAAPGFLGGGGARSVCQQSSEREAFSPTANRLSWPFSGERLRDQKARTGMISPAAESDLLQPKPGLLCDNVLKAAHGAGAGAARAGADGDTPGVLSRRCGRAEDVEVDFGYCGH